MKLCLLIILVTFNFTHSIKLNDFCFRKETCEASSDCKERCYGKFSFKCGHGLCSTNKYNCQSIKLFSIISGHLRNDIQYEEFEKNYQIFLQRIADCPLVDYNWTANDVCLNSKSCYYKPNIPFRLINKKINLIKYTDCDCIGEYSYKCDHNFCARHKNACNESLIKSKEQDNIKKCENSNS